LPHKGFQSRSKGWGRLAKWLLVDGVKPGSGVGWAWDELPVHATNGTPLMLAGGLGPDNVAKAIAQSQPDGVDAASGLEVGGQLDPQKIIEFVANARGASLGRVR